MINQFTHGIFRKFFGKKAPTGCPCGDRRSHPYGNMDWKAAEKIERNVVIRRSTPEELALRNPSPDTWRCTHGAGIRRIDWDPASFRGGLYDRWSAIDYVDGCRRVPDSVR